MTKRTPLVPVFTEELFRNDVRGFLESSGWSKNKLSSLAGVDWKVINRFTEEGSSVGLNSETIEKLWPFIYGDKRPNPEQPPKEAA